MVRGGRRGARRAWWRPTWSSGEVGPATWSTPLLSWRTRSGRGVVPHPRCRRRCRPAHLAPGRSPAGARHPGPGRPSGHPLPAPTGGLVVRTGGDPQDRALEHRAAGSGGRRAARSTCWCHQGCGPASGTAACTVSAAHDDRDTDPSHPRRCRRRPRRARRPWSPSSRSAPGPAASPLVAHRLPRRPRPAGARHPGPGLRRPPDHPRQHRRPARAAGHRPCRSRLRGRARADAHRAGRGRRPRGKLDSITIMSQTSDGVGGMMTVPAGTIVSLSIGELSLRYIYDTFGRRRLHEQPRQPPRPHLRRHPGHPRRRLGLVDRTGRADHGEQP